MRYLQQFKKEPRTCPNCHENVESHGNYCGLCGAYISDIYDLQSNASDEYYIAGFWSRVIARIIDYIFLLILWMFMLQMMVPNFGQISVSELNFNEPLIPTYFIFIMDATKFSYFFIMTQWRGQTLGKMALRLSVVDKNGNLPPVRTVALREFVDKFLAGQFVLITLFTYLNFSSDMQMYTSLSHSILLVIGYICVILNKQRRAWHDYLSNTLVVQRHRRTI